MGRVRVRLRERVRLQRKRVQLNKRHARPWKPVWESEIRGWTANYIRENKWRYEYINEIEDLMQDAYLVFLKVIDSYPRVVEAPHFMAIYKTSIRNAFTDKSREYRRKLELIDETADASYYAGEVFIEPIDMASPLRTLLHNGPEELKLFINFLSDDKNLEQLRAPQRETKGQPRLTFDQRISKLLGIEHFPFKRVLKQFLTSSP